MNEEIRDEILADAIEKYIEAEKTIIKLERALVIQLIVTGGLLTVIFCSLSKMIGG